MIRVLIVDDQASLRRAFRFRLTIEKDIEVIGEAGSGPTAVEQALALRPDVVLMDIRMPGGDGIAATRVLSAQSPPIPVVVMTAFDIGDVVFRALDAGARGFVLKLGDPEEIVQAARAAAHGDGWLSPMVVGRVVDRARKAAPDEAAEAAPGAAALTARGVEIIRALCAGGSTTNEGVGERLGLASATVKSHVSRAMQKLRIETRAELVAWAFRSRLVS